MFADTDGQLVLKYSYVFGCTNELEVHMSCGDSQAMPGVGHHVLNTCQYAINWRSSDFCWDAGKSLCVAGVL